MTMMTSDKKTHVAEIIAGLIAVFGVATGASAWWLGAPIGESAGIAMGFLGSSAMFALVGEGLRTGKMGGKRGKIWRDKDPLKFWGMAIFYVLTGCALFLAIVFLLLLRV